tara:strand:+ start:144 stop:629 length:486 start_codon:yes stop_codon:yes gene_type:complete
MTEEAFLLERAKFEGCGMDLGDWADTGQYQTFATAPVPHIRDGAQVLEMMSRGITVSVESEVRTSVDIAGALATMSDKPLKVSGGDQYNTHCEVHMPGQALSMYNDILLLEDVCSDALQTSLNNGWRIIAACPQADQRRPDYVLGRYNPERQSDDSNADRG